MPQVDFYLLEDSSHLAEQYFICRLVAQLYRKKQSVYLHVEDMQYAEQIDQLLWSFRSDAFIPHEIFSQQVPLQEASLQEGSDNNCSPVVIGFHSNRFHHRDVLINLAEDIPHFYAQFTRIAEIVPGNESKRALLRKHYRFYKDQHCELKTHTISAPAP